MIMKVRQWHEEVTMMHSLSSKGSLTYGTSEDSFTVSGLMSSKVFLSDERFSTVADMLSRLVTDNSVGRIVRICVNLQLTSHLNGMRIGLRDGIDKPIAWVISCRLVG